MANFAIQQKTIANTICEYKNKPQLHCNGKCQLRKKLKQEDNKEQQSPDRKADTKFEIVCSSNSFPEWSFVYEVVTVIHHTFDESRTNTIYKNFFHPPQA